MKVLRNFSVMIAFLSLIGNSQAIEPPEKYAIVIHVRAGKAPSSEEWKREREKALVVRP